MVLCLIVFSALMVPLGVLLENTFAPKKQFADYRGQISVVGSTFSHRVSGSTLWLTVVGTLTNRSDVGWKNVVVEARFLDKSGGIMDVIPVQGDSWTGVSVLPHGEAAFKIEGQAARPVTDYGTYKLFVRWAKDANSIW